ncbi:MAG: Jag N-terminal domain-containing protein, partial [Synergistaceae bacterium]|nr:Jag N-terminal domain-containing protein [Synergistaceae bacterium]
MTNGENTERPSAALDNESMILEVKSLENAIDTACELWKVKENDLETVVLDDGKRLFGLLGRKMKIKVTTLFPLMYLQARDFA